MVRDVYRLHIYYHVRRILKRLQFLYHTKLVLMLLTILTPIKNFFKICADYDVSQDPMKYRDEKFY